MHKHPTSRRTKRQLTKKATIGVLFAVAPVFGWSQGGGVTSGGAGISTDSAGRQIQGSGVTISYNARKFSGLPFHLLEEPAVRSELNLTPGQIESFLEKEEQFHAAIQRQFESGQPDESAMDSAMTRMDKSLRTILKQPQLDRLTQLGLQQSGPIALLQKSIADRLGLSDDQRQSIGEIGKAWKQSLVQGGPRFSGPPSQAELDQMTQSIKTAQAELARQVLGVLTKAQVHTWNEMLGRPFQFPVSNFRTISGGGSGSISVTGGGGSGSAIPPCSYR